MVKPKTDASKKGASTVARSVPSEIAASKTSPVFRKCFICTRDRGKWRKYCDRCRKFVYRAGRKAAHVAALKRDFDPVHDSFRCHYTHIRLEENDTKSPRYLTFDHMIPGNEDIENLVLMFAAYNEKKTDMTYEEHIAFSREVVRAAEGKGFDEKCLDLKYWYRMRRR